MKADDEVTPIRELSKRVTTSDIAKACGVSRATVSYVLNDVPGRSISETTRRRVLDTARALGHVPHGPARLLRSGRSNIVLALVRDYTIGYVADRLIEELDHALADRKYALMVHRYDEDLRSLSELWGLVSPDLIISMGNLTVPDLPPESPVRLVGVQGIYPHYRTGDLQVRYLHSTGHRRLGYAYLTNPRVELTAKARFKGAEDAAKALGLDPLQVTNFASLDDPNVVLAAVDQWTSGPDSVTAVCAHNDELALMIISALQAKGLRPGIDLAVIGVDNIPLSRIGLTTVEIDIEHYTEMVVERVAHAIWGSGPSATPEVSSSSDDNLVRLIVRESA